MPDRSSGAGLFVLSVMFMDIMEKQKKAWHLDVLFCAEVAYDLYR